MLAELYVWEKLRDMEAEVNQSLRHARTPTGTGLTLKELIRCAGVALRQSGQWLESWASPHEPRTDCMPAELTRPARG